MVLSWVGLQGMQHANQILKHATPPAMIVAQMLTVSTLAAEDITVNVTQVLKEIHAFPQGCQGMISVLNRLKLKVPVTIFQHQTVYLSRIL